MAPSGTPDTGDRVRPVYLLSKDIPGDAAIKVSELCLAAENVSGYNTIDGAQLIGALWRIYPKSSEARANLLVNGVTIHNLSITVRDKNPFLVRDTEDGTNTTRLIISDVPMSVANKDLEEALCSMSCKMASKIIYECDRDTKGQLTRFKTGRRFVYIQTPEKKTLKLVFSMRGSIIESRNYMIDTMQNVATALRREHTLQGSVQIW